MAAGSCAVPQNVPQPEQEHGHVHSPGCGHIPGTAGEGGMRIPHSFKHEVVTIECDDGYALTADILRHRRFRNRPLPGVIFLHQEDKERRSFYPLLLSSASGGMNALTIDLRGHGENPTVKGNNPRKGKKLTPEDYAMMVEDVRNAVSFLAVRSDVDGGRIGLVGSALGANLALICASRPWAASVLCVIAISPTLDNQGLKPEESVKGISGKHVSLVAARGHAESFTAAEKFFSLLPEPKEFAKLEGDGRGNALYGQGLISKIPQLLHRVLVKPTLGPPRRP